MGIKVSNIQRFCTQDGPGIRTTVFLKGCTIHCPWCANPENISYKEQYFFDEKKCIKSDGKCILNDKCIMLNNPKINEITIESNYKCGIKALDIYGKEYEANVLTEILKKDILFWGNEGGVTFSGGEPILQIYELESVLKELKRSNVHICVETALFVNKEALKVALKYIDYFFVDVKILDEKACKDVLGGDINKFYENIKLIIDSNKDITFRIPCCEEYTMTDRNLMLLKKFFQNYKRYKVEIFEIHTLAERKYKSLGEEVWRPKKISKEKMINFLEWLKKNGNDAKICKL